MGEKSDRLAQAVNKALLYKLNDVKNPVVHHEFIQTLYEFANSDEYVPKDFSQWVDAYGKMIGTQSKIPMGALYQHLNASKEIIHSISEAFDKNGLTERVKWLITLFYVCGANIDGVRDMYRFEFDDDKYSQYRRGSYQGVGFDADEDLQKFTKIWIQNARKTINNIYKAFDEDDLAMESMYLSDLVSISLETAYIC